MTATTHIDIATFPPSGYIEGVYSIYNCQVGTTRQGKPYLKCLLRDSTGEVSARQWTIEESAIGELETTGFVRVCGHIQLYNGQPQLIIERIISVEISDDEITALLPCTRHNIDEMFERVKQILGSLSHPAMKALAEAYLTDDDLMAQFRRAPAATSLHHAWIGGLLEHTLQLLILAEQILPLYPQLNRDLVLTGLFLHDLGKTSELTWERGFDYTSDGNLIGHVVRGAIWLQVKAAVAAKQSGQRLSPDALRVLQHIIISHHNQPEFGAAKLPSTPEAIFVALLDNLDAKTSMALCASRPDHVGGTNAGLDNGAEFTDKLWALGTRLYRPDPLASE
jgi:3'-5' exoribonuclease